jgi:hypothetical protein
MRIEFLNKIHNDAQKGIRYAENKDKDKDKNKQDDLDDDDFGLDIDLMDF